MHVPVVFVIFCTFGEGFACCHLFKKVAIFNSMEILMLRIKSSCLGMPKINNKEVQANTPIACSCW